VERHQEDGSPEWLHRDQPERSDDWDCPLLQWPRHGGAMDKRGKIRLELDPVVLPQVRGQSGEARVVHLGQQPRQLLEKADVTRGDEALVADQSAGVMILA